MESDAVGVRDQIRRTAVALLAAAEELRSIVERLKADAQSREQPNQQPTKAAAERPE